jgi:hypothetical protein
MLVLNLNNDEAALLTRIVDLYAAELKKAAADPNRRDLTILGQRELPLLRDVLSQLVSQRAA